MELAEQLGVVTAEELAERERVMVLAAPLIREEAAVKDKSYRRYPVGQEVGRFLRYKGVQHAAKATRESYEQTLRRLTLAHRDFADLEPFAARGGEDLLVDFLDNHWGDAAAATKSQRIGALRSFFGWASRTGRISRDPSRELPRPNVSRQAKRRAHELALIRQIVSAQGIIRDEFALLLMGRLALRKMDVGNLQVRDVDLAHDLIYVREGKGGKPAEVPIVYRDVRQAASLWLSERERHAREYLLAPRGHPRRRPNPATVHRWYVRCLERAGVTHFPMHELRHSAADHLWRRTGNVVLAQELLRHESLNTTRDYLHPSEDDLRAGMRAVDEESG